jgi:hypothetical protein
VLKDLEVPPAGLLETIEGLNLTPSDPQHEIPALTVAPATPATPVTAEVFTSLQDLILERDAHALDHTEK